MEKYDLAYLNGYHENYFLLGNTFIDPNFRVTNNWHNTIVETQTVDIGLDGKEYVSLAKFGDALRGLFTDRISVTSLLSYVALYMGTAYWKPLEKYKQQLMLPAAMFSGQTRTGKSTLIIMLKEGS